MSRNIVKPPFGARLRYHLGGRLPIEYRDWVEADIASPGWPWRGLVLVCSGPILGAGRARDRRRVLTTLGKRQTSLDLCLGLHVASAL